MIYKERSEISERSLFLKQRLIKSELKYSDFELQFFVYFAVKNFESLILYHSCNFYLEDYLNSDTTLNCCPSKKVELHLQAKNSKFFVKFR